MGLPDRIGRQPVYHATTAEGVDRTEAVLVDCRSDSHAPKINGLLEFVAVLIVGGLLKAQCVG